MGGVSLILALSVLLSISHADLEFWKSSVTYQIYPRSFADSNGDGNGDLKGIQQHINYLKDLGVGIVWVSPIYKSPMKDQGYDVSDFKDVNEMFGSLQDAKNLINEFHKHGIKFFMDYVPNHSSDEHPWFIASRQNNETYKDFYVWKDPSGWNGQEPLPPNNWVSSFKGIAWKYDNTRKQFYLHNFGDFQPDINYENPKVVDATYENMEFWLNLGVDGFRLDAVPYLVEDQGFKDEPRKPDCQSGDCLDHIYTQNVAGTYKVLQDLMDRIKKKYNSTKFLYLEVYAPQDKSMKYFYKESSPFNFQVIQNVKITTNAKEMKNLVDNYLQNLPKGAWPNWVVGNHDNTRVGTRLGADFIDAANMLVLLLPGSSITYQGEEIGMVDADIKPDRILDCCGRDPERTPFQWDNSTNAGFSSAKNGTWLPVNPNYYYINVQSEKGNPYSHLGIYKRLLEVRKQVVSDISTNTTTIGDWVFLFTRSTGSKKYYIIVNFNNIDTRVVLKSGFPDMPGTVVVHTPSGNANFNIGDIIETAKNITLRPRSGLVVSVSNSAPALLSSLFLLVSVLYAHLHL